ncbi:MAG: hypothetical protein CBR30_07760 [Dictyoglomus sp. NZ13-RE01]|nr:MAG: hypothetical protein CBR30_07760 [Dictyoglomus sp. NZ13-RE01]
MGRRYKNPPVVEALCEFEFIPDREWDMTIPGLVYEKVRKEFPEKTQDMGIGIQLKPSEKGIEQIIEPTPPRLKFIKTDKTALIQIAPHIFVINQLKPYPNWEIFKKMILDNFNVYKEIANPKGLKRIGLRYINNFKFSNSIELSDYFRYYPLIPEGLPKTYSTFLTRVEFPYEEGNENLILSFATVIPEKKEALSLVLDIDYAMITPEYISFDKLPIWLDKAHERIEHAFEESITQKLRETFEEELV